jgi:hypothetical protein
MGASDSKNRVFMADEMIQKTVDQLNMSRRDVRRLWKAFKKFDKDKSGDITVNEFFLALSEEPSIFGDRLFQLIGKSCWAGLGWAGLDCSVSHFAKQTHNHHCWQFIGCSCCLP